MIAIAMAVFGSWKFFPLGKHSLWGRVPNPGLGLVRATLIGSAFWLLVVFVTGAASDIVGFYVAFYVAFAFAGLLWASFSRPILDLWLLSDVVERSNLAAGIVLAGFAAGTTFAFGGALTGEGPGWVVVFVFFLLAYFELRLNVSLVGRISGQLGTEVRQGREVSAGILLAGVAIASGLISGRAAAGDFLGWEVAFKDYGRRLWPMLIVPITASLVGFLSQDSPRRLVIRSTAAGGLALFGAYFYFFT